jgi:hypothetical protein
MIQDHDSNQVRRSPPLFNANKNLNLLHKPASTNNKQKIIPFHRSQSPNTKRTRSSVLDTSSSRSLNLLPKPRVPLGPPTSPEHRTSPPPTVPKQKTKKDPGSHRVLSSSSIISCAPQPPSLPPTHQPNHVQCAVLKAITALAMGADAVTCFPNHDQFFCY